MSGMNTSNRNENFSSALKRISEEMTKNAKGQLAQEIRDGLNTQKLVEFAQQPGVDPNAAVGFAASRIMKSGALFANRVRGRGEWDYKNKDEIKKYHTADGFIIDFDDPDGPRAYLNDVWGNINYGYMGRACSFSEKTLSTFEGLYALVSDAWDASTTSLSALLPWSEITADTRAVQNLASFVKLLAQVARPGPGPRPKVLERLPSFDRPEDVNAVKAGYALFALAGNQVTPDHLKTILRSLPLSFSKKAWKEEDSQGGSTDFSALFKIANELLREGDPLPFWIRDASKNSKPESQAVKVPVKPEPREKSKTLKPQPTLPAAPSSDGSEKVLKKGHEKERAAISKEERALTKQQTQHHKAKADATKTLERKISQANGAVLNDVSGKIKTLGAASKADQIKTAGSRTVRAAKSAFRQGMAFGWPAGPIVGAAAAAATLVAGKVMIGKISGLNFEDGGPVPGPRAGMPVEKKKAGRAGVSHNILPVVNIEVEGEASPQGMKGMQEALDAEMDVFARNLQISRER